jgi:hypothetical protein
MLRERLTADRTYYVRSDALYADAPGLLDSPAGACRTWAQAVGAALALDFDHHTVTIQHGSEAPHTFTVGLIVNTIVGGGRLVISGQAAPGGTVFDVSGADTFYLDNTVSPVQFVNLTARGGAGAIFSVVNGTRCELGSGLIIGAATTYQVWVHDTKSLLYVLNAAITINGGGFAFCFVNMGAAFIEACQFTLVGTPAYASAFVHALNGGAIQSPASAPAVFTGSAVGPRYVATQNGVINTYGGGASYFPGSVAGSVSTGGIYA